MQKGICRAENVIIIVLIKEEGEEFTKLLPILFSICLEKSDVPVDWNITVMVLLYKKMEKEIIAIR